MYGAELSEVYELIYRSRGKNWATEAEDVAREIRSRCPEANSLLDVACGTGAHLATFATFFEHVEGVEIAEPMRLAAEQRLPGVDVHDGDMRDFALGRTFDVVTCLFCAIGHMTTVPDLHRAAERMAAHLNPRGVIVIEPWWFPEKYIDNYVAGDLAQEDGKTVARVSHSTKQGRATHMEVHFLVGDATGIREFTEIDLFTLFTKDEYLTAFAEAGCTLEYLEGGPTGRGLFIGTRQASS